MTTTLAVGRARVRVLTVLATALALVLGGLAGAFPASAAVGQPTTYLDHTYVAADPPSADKPQSKLWFHDGAWWALMVGTGGSAVYIHELLADHTWRNTGVLVDNRANSTGDALYSSQDSTLYVASRVAGASPLQVRSFAYDPAGRTWTQRSSATVATGGGSESASIERDSTGRLWVTYTRPNGTGHSVWVSYLNPGSSTWAAPFTPTVADTAIDIDDLSAIVAFGGNKIGVMYSDQQSGGFHFAVHQDTDPVGVWTSEDVLNTPGMADDHINLKQVSDVDGRVFAAIKTSKGDLATDAQTDPLVGVLTRSTTGVWSFASAGTVQDDHTRPIIMIDKTNNLLYFFATAPATGGDIFYKTSPLSAVDFSSQPGLGRPFVDDPTTKLSNASGSKDPVTTATGMVILTSVQAVKRYAHAEMALGAGGMFDGGGGPVDPAPSVTATSPAANATGVPVTANVTATFSEDVQGVDGSTFQLKDPAGTVVPAGVAYSSASKVATLDPTGSLAASTTYTATLTGGTAAIRDVTGQPLPSRTWSFTTGTSSSPTVTKTVPVAGATGAGVAANVTATFSKAVVGVDGTTFRLATTSGTAVPAVVTQSGTTNTWILNPNANLAPDTRYRATLTGGATAIRDTAGNPLATTSWEFLTGPAPKVSARTPAVNATGVSRTSSPTATFSEPVLGVSDATFTLAGPTGATVTATVTQSGTTNKWILDPSATLAANTKYTVKVTGGATAIRDRAGNPLATVTWSFTTGA